MRMSDWSSDVCSSDLAGAAQTREVVGPVTIRIQTADHDLSQQIVAIRSYRDSDLVGPALKGAVFLDAVDLARQAQQDFRLEHLSDRSGRDSLHEGDVIACDREEAALTALDALHVAGGGLLGQGTDQEVGRALLSTGVLDRQIEVDRSDAAQCLNRSEEHTSELQSLMRISYAVFCLKKKITKITNQKH